MPLVEGQHHDVHQLVEGQYINFRPNTVGRIGSCTPNSLSRSSRVAAKIVKPRRDLAVRWRIDPRDLAR
jgi:hypothetical protein